MGVEQRLEYGYRVAGVLRWDCVANNQGFMLTTCETLKTLLRACHSLTAANTKSLLSLSK